MKKGIATLIGFILVGLGFLGVILSMIGIQFSFLTWIDGAGPLVGFIARLLMIIIGFIIIYLSQGNLENE